MGIDGADVEWLGLGVPRPRQDGHPCLLLDPAARADVARISKVILA